MRIYCIEYLPFTYNYCYLLGMANRDPESASPTERTTNLPSIFKFAFSEPRCEQLCEKSSAEAKST